MTICYTAYFATDRTPEDATEAVRPVVENPAVDTSDAGAEAGKSWITDGPVSIVAWTINWRPGDAEAYGVAATLGVIFDLIAEESQEAKLPMLRDLLALLDKVPGDAVFHDVGDGIVLRRIGGTLELDVSNQFWWTPELFALVPRPFRVRASTGVAFRAVLDPPWTSMEPVRLGRLPPVPGAPDRFVTVENDQGPLLRIDLYGDSECHGFKDACVWSGLVVVGWGDHVYLTDLQTRDTSTFNLGTHFRGIHAHDECLLVTSGEYVYCFGPDRSLLWRSNAVGIDRVIIYRVEGGVIHGTGEWDPPDGWKPFSLDLRTGQPQPPPS